MYEAFFGFSGKPFQLNPDPEFYYGSTQHRRAMAFVEYGLHQSEGFIVVTGEVGAGKTTMIRNLLGNLDSSQVVAAHLVSTNFDADDMVRIVAAAFGLRVAEVPKSELLLSLEAFFAAQAAGGRRCLLIVDEAQNLSARAVEELRMLSNFQLGTHALLQSFLVGQPEFRAILQSPHMHQLRQRVIAACHISPLDPADSRRYIEHRLRHVGWKGLPSISNDAFAAIHQWTNGVPRRINLLCDRVLLSTYLAEQRAITAETVVPVAREIEAETGAPVTNAAGNAAMPGSASAAAAAAVQELVQVEDATPPEHMDAAMHDLEEALGRLEGANQAMLGFFRRFVAWAVARERRRGLH